MGLGGYSQETEDSERLHLDDIAVRLLAWRLRKLYQTAADYTFL